MRPYPLPLLFQNLKPRSVEPDRVDPDMDQHLQTVVRGEANGMSCGENRGNGSLHGRVDHILLRVYRKTGPQHAAVKCSVTDVF